MQGPEFPGRVSSSVVAKRQRDLKTVFERPAFPGVLKLYIATRTGRVLVANATRLEKDVMPGSGC